MTDKGYAQHLVRGGELLRADRVREALPELEEADRRKPGDSRILNLLGLAYFRTERYDEARAIYERLVRRHADDAAMRLNLGLVHLKMGAVDEAIAELERARDLEPKQLRTVGYLGLAYARRGRFAEARDAFHAAGQEELAREMEQQLTQTVSAPARSAPEVGTLEEASAAAAGGSVAAVAPRHGTEGPTGPEPPPTAAPATAGRARGVSAAADLDEGPSSAAAADTLPTDPEPGAKLAAADADRASGEEASPDAEFAAGVVTAAVAAAMPLPAEPVPAPTGAGHRAPQPIAAFAVARLIRPDDGELPFELAAAGSLVVRVRGRLLSRTEGAIASGGDLAYEPATKRARGRTTDEPFGSESRPVFYVTGHGHLVAMPRGGTFTALQLNDDIVYLREDVVYAFEERLGWENGHVPGSSGSVPVVQLRGEGAVAILTRRPPVCVKLAPEKVLFVDAAALTGWIGRVVPRIVAPVAAGDTSSVFIECTGEGVVLIEEPGPAEAS